MNFRQWRKTKLAACRLDVTTATAIPFEWMIFKQTIIMRMHVWTWYIEHWILFIIKNFTSSWCMCHVYNFFLRGHNFEIYQMYIVIGSLEILIDSGCSKLKNIRKQPKLIQIYTHQSYWNAFGIINHLRKVHYQYQDIIKPKWI